MADVTMDSERHRQRRPVFSWLTVLVLCLLCVCNSEAQYAKSSYFMDADSDCYISGHLLIRTDEVVNIMSRNPGSSSSDILRCTLRFKPEDERDITDLSFTHMTISDRGVTLRVDLSGAESLTLRAGASMPRKITAKGSQVTVSLSRLGLQDRDYSFGIIIRVYTEDNTLVGADEKPVAVGMVVGIVAGVIIFVIFMVVIIICCYRRKREQYRSRGPYDPKVDLTSPGHTSSPSFGLDNAAHDRIYPPREEDSSPPVKKKPLLSQTRQPPPPQDLSNPESDSREEVVRNGHPVRPTAFRNENERNRSYNERNTYGERNMYNERNRSYNEPLREGRRRPQTPENDRPQENSRPQKQGGPPKSPIVSALHSNPRFRASFHAAERDANERVRKINGGGDDPANDSDVSMTETWNTTFDTNFDDDPRPPAGSFIKPPTLPPVPMSPREPVRRENLASIHRAPRPSSSSSEMDHLQGEGGAERGVSMNPEGEGPPSPSEIVPIRVQDPHSPSIKRKANAQQARRPRDTQDIDETRTSSADSQISEPPPSKPKSKKSTPSKSKPKADAEKTPQSKKPVEPVKDADEVRNKRRGGKTKPKEPRTEYEGRFRKSDSVRKSKSKSPRIGRSRSTGTGLEDTDSIGQPSTPRGYRAVPSVTADDYEDSDVESNYNPLRRTGSKNSLYASRSSLYSRRRRKNSLGESVYSLAFDDAESERPNRDSFKEHRLSRRDRNFRSLGDLEVELRDQETRSTQTLRECATQTGKGFANVSPGKKIVAKKSKPRSVSSSHTQTAKSKARNLDTSSSSSGVTKPRERRNSASSLTARSKSRDRANSASAVSARAKHRRTDSEVKSDGEGVDRRRPETPRDKPKPKPKPKAKPRKGAGSKGRRDSDDDDDDDLESIRTEMTGPLDHSSAVGRQHNAGVPAPHAMYAPQAYPSYPAGGYPPHMAYMQATGQPPMMMPYAQNAGRGGVPQNAVAVLPNPTAAAVSGPTVTPSAGTARPSQSKWDALCRMTDGGDSAKGGDWNDSASVAGSVLSNPYMNYHQPPPGFSSAMSDYGGSEHSGPARSVTGRNPASRKGGRSAWDTLKEMTDQESQYAASESNV